MPVGGGLDDAVCPSIKIFDTTGAVQSREDMSFKRAVRSMMHCQVSPYSCSAPWAQDPHDHSEARVILEAETMHTLLPVLALFLRRTTVSTQKVGGAYEEQRRNHHHHHHQGLLVLMPFQLSFFLKMVHQGCDGTNTRITCGVVATVAASVAFSANNPQHGHQHHSPCLCECGTGFLSLAAGHDTRHPHDMFERRLNRYIAKRHRESPPPGRARLIVATIIIIIYVHLLPPLFLTKDLISLGTGCRSRHAAYDAVNDDDGRYGQYQSD
jgi:hypothetical protein